MTLIVFLAIVIIPGISVYILYKNQKQLTQNVLDKLNAGYNGKLEVGDSQISPFYNFPYVSIDLKNVVFFEEKGTNSKVIFSTNDIYIGFNLWEILKGKYVVKSVKIEDGFLDLIKDTEGNLNLLSAVRQDSENTENLEGELEISLAQVQLKSFKINYNDLSDLSAIQMNLSKGLASISFNGENMKVDLVSDMVIDYLIGGKPSFFSNKHLSVTLDFDYDKLKNIFQKIIKSFFQLDDLNQKKISNF
jgi:hypothetical protein